MKRVLLVGIISSSLILASIAPAFAEDTATGTAATTTAAQTQVVAAPAQETQSTTTAAIGVKQEKVTLSKFVEGKVLGQYDKAGVDAVKAAGVKGVERIAFIMELAAVSKIAPADVAKMIKEKDGMDAVASELKVTMEQVKQARKAAQAKIAAAKKEFAAEQKKQREAKKAAKLEKIKKAAEERAAKLEAAKKEREAEKAARIEKAKKAREERAAKLEAAKKAREEKVKTEQAQETEDATTTEATK